MRTVRDCFHLLFSLDCRSDKLTIIGYPSSVGFYYKTYARNSQGVFDVSLLRADNYVHRLNEIIDFNGKTISFDVFVSTVEDTYGQIIDCYTVASI